MFASSEDCNAPPTPPPQHRNSLNITSSLTVNSTTSSTKSSQSFNSLHDQAAIIAKKEKGIPSLLPSKLIGLNKSKKTGGAGGDTSFDKKELKGLLEQFTSIDSNHKKNGQITLNEFLQCLGRLNDEDSIDNQDNQADVALGKILFKAFDKDNSGSIDYREFLATMAILSKGTIEQKLEFAFSMIDLDNDKKLSREELQKVIVALYRVLQSLGLNSMPDPIAYANKLFDDMDEEKCGFLTLEAYKKGATRNSSLLIGMGLLENSDNEIIEFDENGIQLLNERDLKNNNTSPSQGGGGGKIIGFGSKKWNLCLNMMIGIRLSSDCIGSIEQRDVRMEDFSVRLMFDLPKDSNNMRNLNNPENLFETSSPPPPEENIGASFTDYAPFVFKHIRKMTGVTEDMYSCSLGPEQLLGSLLLGSLSTLSCSISDGKSGSFFFYSNDGKFMVKTISKSEVATMNRILPYYYNHLRLNPDSLIVKILGFHEMVIDGEKFNFIVMGNIFPQHRSIDELYDLKGSTRGRKNPNGFCKKDLDLLEKKRKFKIGNENKLTYMKIIEKDVEFLSKCNLLDYSLLVGVCNASRCTNTSSSSSKPPQQQQPSPLEAFQALNNEKDSTYSPRRNSGSRFARRNKCVCGIPSIDIARELQDEGEVYYIGIIDILTEYNKKKEAEHTLKSITNKSDAISAIPPKPYSERFFKFMHQCFE